MNIEGAVSVITGGASGLGNATARALHDRAAHVVLIDLPTSKGAAAAEAIGHGAYFVAADVTQENDVQAAVDFAATLGPLRVAVNCAGVVTPGKILGRDGTAQSVDNFARVIAINLIGTYNVLAHAAEKMAALPPIDGERGVIINTASVAAFDGQIGQPAYAASKGGVAALTLPAARELARHLIRVATIAPGIFETPMIAGLPEEARQSLGQQVPHPSRLGKPTEYAALATHIVENPMLNGETIRLDGAIRMGPT